MDPGFTLPVLDHGFVRYIDHMGTDTRIVEAARVSFAQPSKGAEADKKLLNYLWKNKHTSPFEMVKVTLDVKMPIFVARQWHRHRMQNINEVSARYTELPGEFYIPKKWRKNLGQGQNQQQSEVVEDWDVPLEEWYGKCMNEVNTEFVTDFCEDAYNKYQALLARGVARELARMILPLNIYTQFYDTWDIKNLLHFVELRDDAHAQWEIQQYGLAIKSILTELFPWTMEAYAKVKFIATTV